MRMKRPSERRIRHEQHGQSCNAPTRMLVQRDIYDQAVEIATETAAKVTVGSASEEGRHIGPVVNAVQFEKSKA